MRAPLSIAAAAALLSAEAAVAADLTSRQRADICSARTTCEVGALTPAGTGGGAPLVVVEVRLGVADRPDWGLSDGCRSGGEAYDGGREYWLLRGQDAPQFLFALCSDGYGSGGYDEVTVADNRIMHLQTGGNSWRFERLRTHSLVPYRVIGERRCEYHSLGSWTGVATDMDADRLEARSVGWKRGDEAAESGVIGCPDWPSAFAAVPTPDTYAGWNVPAPMGVDAGPLPADIALGDCALRLKSDGSAGFLSGGAPAGAADAAEVRIIAEYRERLFVQVYDPTATDPTATDPTAADPTAADPTAADAASPAAGASSVDAPHLEIWAAPDDYHGGDWPAESAAQITVGLDGAVHPGPGNPRLPQATRWTARDEAGRAVTVLRLEWPPASLAYGVAVAYAQGGGGAPVRLVSTVGFADGRPLMLPRIWGNAWIESGLDTVACELRDGVLMLVR